MSGKRTGACAVARCQTLLNAVGSGVGRGDPLEWFPSDTPPSPGSAMADPRLDGVGFDRVSSFRIDVSTSPNRLTSPKDSSP
jgi:hypothetical protein